VTQGESSHLNCKYKGATLTTHAGKSMQTQSKFFS